MPKHAPSIMTLLLAAMNSMVFSDEQQVTAYPGEEPKDGIIESPVKDLSLPEEVIPLDGGRIKIISKIFTPPEGFIFKNYPDGTFVDIKDVVGAIDVGPDPDTALQIGVHGTFIERTAVDFPLEAEVNLVPSTSGGTGVATSAPPLYHWAAKIPSATLHIQKVPDYLYANATYWVPIKFHIDGLGEHVRIEAGYKINFYANGNLQAGFPVIDAPFAYDDGLNQQQNGSHTTYTAWIDPAIMNKIMDDSPSTLDSEFQIIGDFTDTDSGVTIPGLKSLSEAPDRPLVFSDAHVAVAEIGKSTTFKPTDATQTFFETCHDGSIDFSQSAENGQPLNPESPKTIDELPILGFVTGTLHSTSGISGGKLSGPAMSSQAGLTAANFTPGFGGTATARVQICGLSLGIYWGNSYGHSSPIILNGSYGMDLSQKGLPATLLSAYSDGIEGVVTNGVTTEGGEFNAQEELPSAFNILVYALNPEEWALCETASMLTEGTGLLEKAIAAIQARRTADVNFRYGIIVAKADGSGQNIYMQKQEHVHESASDLKITDGAGSYSENDASIAVGNTTYFIVEVENGVDCIDLFHGFVNSTATYTWGSTGIVVNASN